MSDGDSDRLRTSGHLLPKCGQHMYKIIVALSKYREYCLICVIEKSMLIVGDDTDSSPELLQQEPHRNDDSSIRTTEEGTPFNDSSTDNDGDDEDDEEEMIRPDITNTSVRKVSTKQFQDRNGIPWTLR